MSIVESVAAFVIIVAETINKFRPHPLGKSRTKKSATVRRTVISRGRRQMEWTIRQAAAWALADRLLRTSDRILNRLGCHCKCLDKTSRVGGFK